MSWEKTVPLADIEQKPRVFKRQSRQIALFRVGDEYFAIDNRCPHEGYPLAEGTVDDACVLTCNWHNWKFRLRDGECVLGGDHVRAYDVRSDDGYLWVNLSDPPLEVIESRILEGLRAAFDDRDFGRICREIARLRFNNLNPRVAVRKAIEWSYDRFEFGMTHAFAATADWLAQSERFKDDGERQLICLGEAVDHIAFDALRHRVYPYGKPAGDYSDAELLFAIESQQTAHAESLVQRAIQQGDDWSSIEGPLTAAALEHYNDFGHSLIYVYKTRQVIELLGADIMPELAQCLTRSIAHATREDLIPEFSAYESAIRDFPPLAHDSNSHLESPFPASLREAFTWVTENADRHSAQSLYDALLTALAQNMLHFDTSFGSAYDRPVSQNVGWLNFTHGITFANAVRNLCAHHPNLWPAGLLQMACFVGRNRQFIDTEFDEHEWFSDNRVALFEEAHEIILDHGLRDPIFSAHLLKTTVAVEEELSGASETCQRYLLAGLNRFLHSPIKQKHTRRLARQAIELVGRDFR